MPAKRTSSKQKAAAFERELFSTRHMKSELASLLIGLWSWGHVPAVLVQKIAQAAVQDGRTFSSDFKINEWEILANLGNSGMNIQNVARDLIRKLPPALCSQSEKQVAVKVSVSKSVCRLAQVNLPFLHPSSFWRSAYQSGHVWRQCICQNEELIEQFWSQCGHHPALAEHKVKRIHNFRRRAIPVVLHGDGASVTQNIGSASKSCMFLSWRSLCTPTPQHFLITALWTTMKAQGRIGCSVKSIFRIVSSFFEDLLAEEGRFSNGYFPVLCFSTGDIEYFNQWHLQPRWNATLPCPLCSVHQKRLADFSTVQKMAPEPWRDQRPHQQCPLFRNVMSQKAISPDYMHSKHLGIDGRFLGSVCWLIIFQLMDQQMPLDHRLGQLLFQIKDPWRCLMHFFGIHFFVFFLHRNLTGILEAWILSPQQSDFGSLGLFDSTSCEHVSLHGSSAFGWLIFSFPRRNDHQSERAISKESFSKTENESVRDDVCSESACCCVSHIHAGGFFTSTFAEENLPEQKDLIHKTLAHARGQANEQAHLWISLALKKSSLMDDILKEHEELLGCL